MKSKSVDMLSGSITKGLLSMSLPIMAMNVMQSMFNVIDMTVLGNFSNDTAVGAVGACGMLITLCTGLFIGVSAGANVVVAKHIGERDKKQTNEAVSSALAFAILSGFFLLIIGVCFAKTFLRWTNCPDDILPQAVTYFRIYFMGVPVIMLYNFCASILRAAGDTKRPLYFLMISGVIKIILNFMCITLFNMTVEGVAIATIVSNAIAATFALITLCRMPEK